MIDFTVEEVPTQNEWGTEKKKNDIKKEGQKIQKACQKYKSTK